MAKRIFLVPLIGAMIGWAHAEEPVRMYEGAWIWDRAAYIPPPNMPEMTHMLTETLLVSHDNGSRYTAHLDQLYDAGQSVHQDMDFPEDGMWHAVRQAPGGAQMSMAVLIGGDRLMQYRDAHGSQSSRCHVWAGGMTMSCQSTYVPAVGTGGDLTCVYHRDPHMVPVAMLARAAPGPA